MFTIDASVWVNSFDQREPGHEVSRQLLTQIASQSILITIPTLALVEVAGAISRTRNNPVQSQAFADALSRLPNLTLRSLDLSLAQQATRIASQAGLRGADAVYAAVAVQAGYTLVTLDNEQLTRLTNIVQTQTPSLALARSRIDA